MQILFYTEGAIYPPKPDLNVSNTYNFGPYLIVNTLRFHYKY
jgi:hypothetical protein